MSKRDPDRSYVTQKDIARVAKVSQSSVGAALGRTNKIRVSDETRERVLRAAAQLNYTPNLSASVTRSGRSKLIAIIDNSAMARSSFWRMIHFAELFSQHGFTVRPQELKWHGDCSLQNAWQEAMAARVEAVILSSSLGMLKPDDFRNFVNSPVPVISVCGPMVPGIPLIGPNLRDAFREITARLIREGRRRLVFLVPMEHPREHSEEVTGAAWKRHLRVQGWQEAIEASSEAVSAEMVKIWWDDLVYDEYRLGANEFVRLMERGGAMPDAIVCCNDSIAMGVLTEAAQRGIKVPEELAVTGCDGELWTAYGPIPITTIEQPCATIAKAGVEMVLNALDGKEAPTLPAYYPCEVLWRRSSGGAWNVPPSSLIGDKL